MKAHFAGKGRSRNRLYVLAAILGLLIVVLAYSVGSRTRESARFMVSPGGGAWFDKEMRARGGVQFETPMRAGGGAAGPGPAGLAGARSEAKAAESRPAWVTIAHAAAITPAPSARMVIYVASLELRVEDVAKAHEEVASIARAADGYVSESTLNAEAGPTYATVTIRVPAQALEKVITRVAALGKVLNKQMNAQEITEEYVDLTSRRRNLEREESRLLELLQRAGKVRDLLEVEETLGRVRGEIETISGRLRHLENRVALSTLRVALRGPERMPTAGGPAWAATDVTRQAVRSLLSTGRGLATMGIWLGVYTPVWLPILIVAILVVRKTRRAPAPAS